VVMVVVVVVVVVVVMWGEGIRATFLPLLDIIWINLSFSPTVH